MKNYIWTYWTKPQRSFISYIDLASLCLSVELIKKHGNPFCVYTDSFGKKLIEEVGLDVKISLALDKIEHISSEKWAIAKMISYLNSIEPCCHIDTDIFLWGEQKIDTNNIDFVVQAHEDSNIYKYVYNDYICDALTVPKEVLPFAAEGVLEGFNMGYVDIHNIDFLHKYAERCIEVYEPMKTFSNFNALFPEQCLFYCMTGLERINIKELFKKGENSVQNHWEYVNSLQELSYTHLMNAKRSHKDKIMNLIVKNLRELNPKLAQYFYYIVRTTAHLSLSEQDKEELKTSSIGVHLL